jgi:hypothetical protein
MKDEEHRIQAACVRWFRYQYPAHRNSLFAVPNGGRRDAATGARLKDEGVLPGVSDLILLKPTPEHHALLIEMKTAKGRQSPSQKQWQQYVERDKYKYVVCHSFDEFRETVEEYMNLVAATLSQHSEDK